MTKPGNDRTQFQKDYFLPGDEIKITNIANYRRLSPGTAQQLYIRYYPVTVENIFCFVFCDSVSCIFS